ncbi:MAG: sigma-70 family RNA polymerase sigma factor [Acidobacteriota bacterium]
MTRAPDDDRPTRPPALSPLDPDLPWVEDWQRGRQREQAFRALFDRHAAAVYSFYRRRGFAPDRADDLVQEAFLGVYRGLDTFRRDVSFRRWLFGIAANVFRKALRHASAQKRAGDERPFDEQDVAATSSGRRASEPRPTDPGSAPHRGRPFIAPPTPEPMRHVLGRERLAEVVDGLRQMPPQMRRCAELGWYHGLSHREIASHLGVSAQTVKVQLFRARQRLARARREEDR